ncbi:hypothetical protein CFE70_010300 [Pyrenophora teres f. teres 0-1]
MPSSVASDDIIDDDGFIVDIDAIQAHGIGAVDIAKLKANGYYTIASVHSATRRNLLKIKGFSEIKVDKVKDAIGKCQPSGGGFQTAHELGQQRKRVIKISTGSKALDAVLGGPERIAQIAERFGVDPETAQDNITYARAVNSEHQMELLNKVAEFFVSNEYRLLIIDSIMALFRVDYTGRGELNERQQKLNQFLSKLTHVAEVQSDPGASALFAGADGRKPVGGHILAHASATRILLRKGRGEERVAKIQDSPEKEATYIITNGGINDPEKV